MKIFDVYVQVTQRKNSSTTGQEAVLKKEFIVAGETVQEAAQRASYEARGYVSLNPLVFQVAQNDFLVTGVKILEVHDLGYSCVVPVKHRNLNYSL